MEQSYKNENIKASERMPRSQKPYVLPKPPHLQSNPRLTNPRSGIAQGRLSSSTSNQTSKSQSRTSSPQQSLHIVKSIGPVFARCKQLKSSERSSLVAVQVIGCNLPIIQKHPRHSSERSSEDILSCQSSSSHLSDISCNNQSSSQKKPCLEQKPVSVNTTTQKTDHQKRSSLTKQDTKCEKPATRPKSAKVNTFIASQKLKTSNQPRSSGSYETSATSSIGKGNSGLHTNQSRCEVPKLPKKQNKYVVHQDKEHDRCTLLKISKNTSVAEPYVGNCEEWFYDNSDDTNSRDPPSKPPRATYTGTCHASMSSRQSLIPAGLHSNTRSISSITTASLESNLAKVCPPQLPPKASKQSRIQTSAETGQSSNQRINTCKNNQNDNAKNMSRESLTDATDNKPQFPLKKHVVVGSQTVAPSESSTSQGTRERSSSVLKASASVPSLDEVDHMVRPSDKENEHLPPPKAKLPHIPPPRAHRPYRKYLDVDKPIDEERPPTSPGCASLLSSSKNLFTRNTQLDSKCSKDKKSKKLKRRTSFIRSEYLPPSAPRYFPIRSIRSNISDINQSKSSLTAATSLNIEPSESFPKSQPIPPRRVGSLFDNLARERNSLRILSHKQFDSTDDCRKTSLKSHGSFSILTRLFKKPPKEQPVKMRTYVVDGQVKKFSYDLPPDSVISSLKSRKYGYNADPCSPSPSESGPLEDVFEDVNDSPLGASGGKEEVNPVKENEGKKGKKSKKRFSFFK